MKVLFEDDQESTGVMVGLNLDAKLEITSIYYNEEDCRIKAISSNINIEQAYELSTILSKFISKMEEEHRKKLPLWKRLF